MRTPVAKSDFTGENFESEGKMFLSFLIIKKTFIAKSEAKSLKFLPEKVSTITVVITIPKHPRTPWVEVFIKSFPTCKVRVERKTKKKENSTKNADSCTDLLYSFKTLSKYCIRY